jgi:hypothetical protein
LAATLVALVTTVTVARDPAPAHASGGVVAYAGRAGSFGTLGATTPVDAATTTSVSVGTGAPAGWGFRPGQAAWFTTLAGNGDLVVADQPQTDDPSRPTADHMAVSTYRPPASGDPSGATLGHQVIPTTTGATTAFEPGKPVGGADVEDVQLVPASGSRPERIAFTSAVPYSGWDASTTGEYPALGFLRRSGSTWSFDGYAGAGGVSRTAGQLAASTSDTALADATCPVVFLLRDCGGLNEISLLPRSGNLVLTQYYGPPGGNSGGIVVVSPEGALLAHYAYPTVYDNGGSTALEVRPREVKADPTSPAGQDRFVVIFDTFDPTRPANDREVPFAAQEFSYTSASGIVPTTYAFRADHATDVGFESALYDSAGNLWLAQRHRASLSAAPLARYTRTELTTNCSPQWGWWNFYGNTCTPHDTLSAASGLGYSMSLDEDPVTHDILNTTLSGYLQSIRRTGTSPYTFSQRLVVNLGINNLRDRSTYLVSPRKATVDGTARRYYVPVQLLQNPATTGSSCGWWMNPPAPCAPPVLDQWLVTVDLHALLGT